MLVYADAQMLDVAGPLEVFARSARLARETLGFETAPYEVEIVAAERGPVAMSSGIELIATRSIDEDGPIDTLLIAGGIGFAAAAADPKMIRWVEARAKTARRIASICTGAFLLAAAGLLRERTATTHWAYCDRLSAVEPSCLVNRDAIFVKDGKLHSSAGVTAGMDLALALVEEDLGSAVALQVAQQLVMYVKRPGGQAQFSRHLEAQQRDDRFGALHLWLMDNLDRVRSVDDLAREAGMSPRHFTRRFTAQMGRPPGAYLARMRVEQARQRIEQGSLSLKEVARSSGFGNEQALRRAFQRELKVSPSDYLARFSR
jgi:transcriptional regulator GlxA family with amidase domain